MTLVIDAAEWPHGLRCLDCDCRLLDGMPYWRRQIGMAGGLPAVEIVCVRCAVA